MIIIITPSCCSMHTPSLFEFFFFFFQYIYNNFLLFLFNYSTSLSFHFLISINIYIYFFFRVFFSCTFSFSISLSPIKGIYFTNQNKVALMGKLSFFSLSAFIGARNHWALVSFRLVRLTVPMGLLYLTKT